MNPSMMGGMGKMPGLMDIPNMMPGMMGGMTGVMPDIFQMMRSVMSPMVGRNQMNSEEDDEWMKGFKMAVWEVNSSADSDENKPGQRVYWSKYYYWIYFSLFFVLCGNIKGYIFLFPFCTFPKIQKIWWRMSTNIYIINNS